jgi:hypothetical protein
MREPPQDARDRAAASARPLACPDSRAAGCESGRWAGPSAHRPVRTSRAYSQHCCQAQARARPRGWRACCDSICVDALRARRRRPWHDRAATPQAGFTRFQIHDFEDPTTPTRGPTIGQHGTRIIAPSRHRGLCHGRPHRGTNPQVSRYPRVSRQTTLPEATGEHVANSQQTGAFA